MKAVGKTESIFLGLGGYQLIHSFNHSSTLSDVLLNFRERQLLEESDHETILNILLQNPEELNLKEKLSAIRENKIFTPDMRVIPISSAQADDIGAYISQGSDKRLFHYNSEGSRTVYKNENGVFYAIVKTSKGYKKEYVPESEV